MPVERACPQIYFVLTVVLTIMMDECCSFLGGQAVPFNSFYGYFFINFLFIYLTFHLFNFWVRS